MEIRKTYRKVIPESVRRNFYRLRRQLVKYHSVNWFDPNVRAMSSRLKKMKGVYHGQRCFIMGNGPSLNKMNLNLLKNEIVWGSNRCYLLFDRLKWRPKFYVATDRRVVSDNADEMNLLSERLAESIFFYPVFFRYDQILKSYKNVYWYKAIAFNEDNLPYSMFSLDPSQFVYYVSTVTVAALQLAVYLGFNPIYLIGCDTSYTIPKTIEYEGNDSNLLISTTDDPNHFDPDYFGKGKKWHDPHVERMIINYEQAKKICDERNIQIINATVGGNLEVFPRVNYDELF